MHTPECRDGIDWWPQGAPTEIDVSTLPASGLLTHPLRVQGAGPWLGIWGTFAGARIAYSASESFMLQNGSAIPWPSRPFCDDTDRDTSGVDLYLSKDTNASGTLAIARFKTREAALAWVGQRSSGRSITAPGTINGPYTPGDAQANPTDLVGVESFTMGFQASGALWERIRAIEPTADAQASLAFGTSLLTSGIPWVFNDRTTNADRLRQPDSFSPRRTTTTGTSIASTGVKATLTAAQDGYLVFAMVNTQTGTPTNAVISLDVNTVSVGWTPALAATLNAAYPVGVNNGGANQSPWKEIPILSGDVIDLNVRTAAGAAATASFYLGIRTQRAAF